MGKRRLSWAVMIDGRSIWTLNAVQKNPNTERHYANLEALNIGGGTLLGQSWGSIIQSEKDPI